MPQHYMSRPPPRRRNRGSPNLVRGGISPFPRSTPADPLHLETSPGPRHNLPAQPAELIGRHQDVATLTEQITRPDVRLVTLVGPPGIGKTRLALAVATGLIDRFADGVFFVDLAPVDNPGQVAPTIAHALGLRDSVQLPPMQRLVGYLRERQILLVLDNFEQVIAASPEISALLAGTLSPRLLVTSREVLRVRWEHSFVVSPLDIPVVKPLPDLGALGSNPSVALFIQRARAVRPEFTLTPANAAAVSEICRQLEGVPLAIELAAARTRVFEPDGLVARLRQRLDVLGSGGRDLPSRQRTLREAIAWSDSLLSSDERGLFRRLSAFVGGWDLEAAEVVCGDEAAGTPVVELLTSLVDKSLVRREGRTGSGARFAMLEVIREYAHGQLVASGELSSVRQRHIAHYLSLAETAEPELWGPNQIAWLDRLETEHDNLRAALRGSLEFGDIETALRLAGALWKFWWVHGHLLEGQRWLDEALARSQGQDSAARAKALSGSGNFTRFRGDLARSVTLHEESLAVQRKIGNQRGIGTSLQNLGMAWRGQKQYERAQALLEEGLAQYREINETHGVALALNNLGLVARDLGNLDRAAALHQESLALRRALGDKLSIAHSINDLGVVVGDRGDVERAAALHRESLAIFRDLMDTLEIAVCLERLAWMASAQKQADLAVQLFAAAERVRGAVGVTLPLPYEADHERWLAAARRQLGEGSFQAAWSTGTSLSLEAAMDLAQARSPAATREGEPSPVLTIREREVVALLAQGLSNRQIADRLVISERTAEAHVANVRAKLGLSSRAQIAAWAVEAGFPTRDT